jgi:hypothetical protein
VDEAPGEALRAVVFGQEVLAIVVAVAAELLSDIGA